MATGKERVSTICRQMTPGITIGQLTEQAKEHRLLGKRRAGMAFTYLAEIRSYGHHACRVDFENNVVKSATYNHAD